MTARITGAWRAEEVPEVRGGRACVRLLEPLEYRVGHADSDEVILVPAGFVTDFASIPWGLRNIFPPMGKYSRAAIIHDWLYANAGKLPGRTYTRAQADDIFREAMGVLGVSWLKRQAMWSAVRAGGWVGWKSGSDLGQLS